MKKGLLKAHRTDVAVISDDTQIYRAAPVINSQLLRLVSEGLLEALRQGGGADGDSATSRL